MTPEEFMEFSGFDERLSKQLAEKLKDRQQERESLKQQLQAEKARADKAEAGVSSLRAELIRLHDTSSKAIINGKEYWLLDSLERYETIRAIQNVEATAQAYKKLLCDEIVGRIGTYKEYGFHGLGPTAKAYNEAIDIVKSVLGVDE